MTGRIRVVVVGALILGVLTPALAEPDAARLGAPDYPIGTARTWMRPEYRVGSWSNMNAVPGLRHRAVPRGGNVMPLPRADAEPAIAYRFANRDYSLDDYLQRRRVTGLLIAKDGRILVERYRYGRTEEARFLSFSMAKTIIALLIGIARDKRHIESLDDPVTRYLPALEGSEYGRSTLRHLLRMSSGMRFVENYDGRDDIARLNAVLSTPRGDFLGFVRGRNERDHPSGEKFHYASIETVILGRALEAAAKENVATLTSRWLWQPMGAERDALWRLDGEDKEGSHGSFNASLRDWARLGVLLARDGARHDVVDNKREGQAPEDGGRQIIPRDFLLEATDPERQPVAFRPRQATPALGYGYQVWLVSNPTRTFMLQGIHGQAVLVQPASGIVIVQTAVFEQASGRADPVPTRERGAFFNGVLRSLGGEYSSS